MMAFRGMRSFLLGRGPLRPEGGDSARFARLNVAGNVAWASTGLASRLTD